MSSKLKIITFFKAKNGLATFLKKKKLRSCLLCNQFAKLLKTNNIDIFIFLLLRTSIVTFTLTFPQPQQ
jgi:hypothetical protein